MLRSLRLFALSAFVLLSLRAVKAQQHSAPAPRLTVSTESGHSTFHIGERIPVVLSFTGPDDQSFAIDLAHYDRSGRMFEDTFNVEPRSGWVDPLAAYFRYGFHMMGGLRGGKFLSSSPEVLTANLNEWVRFDEPGTYELMVTSHRVGHASNRGDRGAFPQDRLDLVSANSVTLTIIPATHEWQEGTLRRIVHELPKSSKPSAIPHEPSPTEENAFSDLRFLATTPAVRMLVSQLRDDSNSQWNAYLGLIGLPHAEHEEALVSMRSLLGKPDFPVGTMFLEAMSWLRMPEDDQPILSDQKVMEAAAKSFEQKKIKARDDEWRNAVLVLHEKKDAARSTTQTTLLETLPSHPDPGLAEVLGADTRASFAQMSAPDQSRVLEEHWDLIRSRELLPQLRAIAQGPPLADSDALPPFYSPRGRAAIALRRWCDLEPEGASAEAIHQIGRAYPQLYASEVDYLSPQTFPQFEPLWAKTLAESDDTREYEPAASLLLRFGTGAVSAQMSRILQHPKDHLGNRTQPALAYLVKFEPNAAQALLQSDPSLLSGRLDSIAKDTSPSTLLTATALRQLANPDENGMSDALTYLRHFGDEDVREPILHAFLAWYERNKELAESDPSGLSREQSEQIDLGEEFVRTLLCNQGWMPDAKLTSDVLRHAIGPQMHATAERISKGDFDVTMFGGDGPMYEIGSYETPDLTLFEAKLDQFPPGTQFVLQHVSSPSQPSQDRLEASLTALFLKHGMKLVMPGSA